MRIYDNVHVDWSKDSLYGDCWNQLFTNGLYDKDADVIYDYPFYDLTAECASVLYRNEGWGWRKRLHPLWAKLWCKVNAVPRGNVGVLVRSDGVAGEQEFGRSQLYGQYAEHLQNGMNVYLVTRDHETLDWFTALAKSRFFHLDYERTARNQHRSDPDFDASKGQSPSDAIAAVREVLTLSMCDTLIHGVSNMATASLIINPNQKSIYLR